MHSDRISHDHLTELIACRDAVETAMAHYLAGRHQGVATDDDKDAARRLFDVLLTGDAGGAIDDPAMAEGLRRHASRFGDGLSPILRDALGAEVPEAFIAGCVDRYWRSVRLAIA